MDKDVVLGLILGGIIGSFLAFIKLFLYFKYGYKGKDENDYKILSIFAIFFAITDAFKDEEK